MGQPIRDDAEFEQPTRIDRAFSGGGGKGSGINAGSTGSGGSRNNRVLAMLSNEFFETTSFFRRIFESGNWEFSEFVYSETNLKEALDTVFWVSPRLIIWLFNATHTDMLTELISQSNQLACYANGRPINRAFYRGIARHGLKNLPFADWIDQWSDESSSAWFTID